MGKLRHCSPPDALWILEWMNSFKLIINLQVRALFELDMIYECRRLFLESACCVVAFIAWHEIENTGFRNESYGGVAFSATAPVNFKYHAPPFYLFPIKVEF